MDALLRECGPVLQHRRYVCYHSTGRALKLHRTHIEGNDTLETVAPFVASALHTNVQSLYFFYRTVTGAYRNLAFDAFWVTNGVIRERVRYDETLKTVPTLPEDTVMHVFYTTVLLRDVDFHTEDDGTCRIFCITRDSQAELSVPSLDVLFPLDAKRMRLDSRANDYLMYGVHASQEGVRKDVTVRSKAYEVTLRVSFPTTQLRTAGIYQLMEPDDEVIFIAHTGTTAVSWKGNAEPESNAEWATKFERQGRVDCLLLKIVPRGMAVTLTVTVASTGSVDIRSSWSDDTGATPEQINVLLETVNRVLFTRYAGMTEAPGGPWCAVSCGTHASLCNVNVSATLTHATKRVQVHVLSAYMSEHMASFFVKTGSSDAEAKLRFTRVSSFCRKRFNRKYCADESTVPRSHGMNLTIQRLRKRSPAFPKLPEGWGTYITLCDVTGKPRAIQVRISGGLEDVHDVLALLRYAVYATAGKAEGQPRRAAISVRDLLFSVPKAPVVAETAHATVTSVYRAHLSFYTRFDYVGATDDSRSRHPNLRLVLLRAFYRVMYGVELNKMFERKGESTYIHVKRGYSSKCQPPTKHPVIVPEALLAQLRDGVNRMMDQVDPASRQAELLLYRRDVLDAAVLFPALDEHWYVITPSRFDMQAMDFVPLDEEAECDTLWPYFKDGFYFRDVDDTRYVPLAFPCGGKREKGSGNSRGVNSNYVLTRGKYASEGQMAQLPATLDHIFPKCVRTGVHGGSFWNALSCAFDQQQYVQRRILSLDDATLLRLVRAGPLQADIEPTVETLYCKTGDPELPKGNLRAVIAYGEAAYMACTPLTLSTPFDTLRVALLAKRLTERYPESCHAGVRVVFVGLLRVERNRVTLTCVDTPGNLPVDQKAACDAVRALHPLAEPHVHVGKKILNKGEV